MFVGGAGGREQLGRAIVKTLEDARSMRDGRARDETVAASRAGKSIKKCIGDVLRVSVVVLDEGLDSSCRAQLSNVWRIRNCVKAKVDRSETARRAAIDIGDEFQRKSNIPRPPICQLWAE